jgi:glycosyltransferase involved in cell wall biosynthesis
VTREIHQFLPTFARYDAIGMHTLRMRDVLRESGGRSEIFAADIHAEVRGEGHDYRSVARHAGPDATFLYHASTASPMAAFLAEQGRPLLIDYHNVTEPAFFDRWSPEVGEKMRRARAELRDLVPVTQAAMADSPFNEEELRRLGFSPTAVVPILIDFAEYDVAPDEKALHRRRRTRERGGADWLFVGRLSPNKCVHDVIGSFAVYRAACDPSARLTIVGGPTVEGYLRAVERLIGELEVEDAVQLVGNVPLATLAAIYRTSDVFVMLSEHEGFNVPVLEAMHFGVPVVAFASTAVPGTVEDAGVLLAEKGELVVAAAVEAVLGNPALQAQLRAAGHARVEHFSLANTRRRLHEVLDSFLAERA